MKRDTYEKLVKRFPLFYKPWSEVQEMQKTVLAELEAEKKGKLSVNLELQIIRQKAEVREIIDVDAFNDDPDDMPLFASRAQPIKQEQAQQAQQAQNLLEQEEQ